MTFVRHEDDGVCSMRTSNTVAPQNPATSGVLLLSDGAEEKGRKMPRVRGISAPRRLDSGVCIR